MRSARAAAGAGQAAPRIPGPEITPVVEAIPATVDVRIVAATNRDLRMVNEGRHLREPVLPPQRSPGAVAAASRATQDIPILVGHFLDEMDNAEAFSARSPLREGALALMSLYAWPGNVREMENLLRATGSPRRQRHHPAPPICPSACVTTAGERSAGRHCGDPGKAAPSICRR